MQIDFHYYATYCAAFLAGYSHEECLAICYSAQFTDCCTRTLLSTIGGPSEAATTQLQLEMMDARTDLLGLQDITRIWASFHFLPRDLKADPEKGSRIYKAKYRLICGPNGDLLVKTVNLAKDKSLQAAGIAMHVLADTWAHQYFAGTPSQVINNTDYWFFELLPAEASGDSQTSRDSEASGNSKRAFTERRITFRHNPTGKDDLDKGIYTSTVYQLEENSVMSLGHGRAGHLPDYSFMRYKYLPAWGKYEEVIKDNPSDYYKAFCQMVYALRYLRGDHESFEADRYDTEKVSPRSRKSSRRGSSTPAPTGRHSESNSQAAGSRISTRTSIVPSINRRPQTIRTILSWVVILTRLWLRRPWSRIRSINRTIFWPATRWNTARAVSWESGTSYTTLSIKGKRRRHE